MTLRTAVILMAGVQAALAAGALTALAGHSWPLAGLAAGTTFSGAVAFARSLID
ncbi:hypothetical protein ACFV2C_16050 [[Kitasatospora] papulosa]|uniref:hypothetical protein n=1 Tax=[Kitasatospora] papulosa TaxID=1464011 RepID=UPI003682F153